MPSKNGKICYIEIPTSDIRRSSTFYSTVFGWQLRQRGDGSIAFDDTTGEVSGTWVLGRPAAAQPGLLLYVMVDSVEATAAAVVQRRRDRAADRGGRTRDHREVPRPGRKHDRPVPGAGAGRRHDVGGCYGAGTAFSRLRRGRAGLSSSSQRYRKTKRAIVNGIDPMPSITPAASCWSPSAERPPRRWP